MKLGLDTKDKILFKVEMIKNFKFKYNNNLLTDAQKITSLYEMTQKNNIFCVNNIKTTSESLIKTIKFMNKFNEIFKKVNFKINEYGLIYEILNKEELKSQIEKVRQKLLDEEPFKKKLVNEVCDEFRNKVENTKQFDGFLEDVEFSSVYFSGIYGEYKENKRKIKRKIRNLFAVPIPVIIEQEIIDKNMKEKTIELIINAERDEMQLDDYIIQEIFSKQEDYEKSNFEFIYRGKYKMNYETGEILFGTLNIKLSYGNDYELDVNIDLEEYNG